MSQGYYYLFSSTCNDEVIRITDKIDTCANQIRSGF